MPRRDLRMGPPRGVPVARLPRRLVLRPRRRYASRRIRCWPRLSRCVGRALLARRPPPRRPGRIGVLQCGGLMRSPSGAGTVGSRGLPWRFNFHMPGPSSVLEGCLPPWRIDKAVDAWSEEAFVLPPLRRAVKWPRPRSRCRQEGGGGKLLLLRLVGRHGARRPGRRGATRRFTQRCLCCYGVREWRGDKSAPRWVLRGSEESPTLFGRRPRTAARALGRGKQASAYRASCAGWGRCAVGAGASAGQPVARRAATMA